MEGATYPTINCPDCKTELHPHLIYNTMGEVLLYSDCPHCQKQFSEPTTFAAMIRSAADPFELRVEPIDFDIKDMEVTVRIQ